MPLLLRRVQPEILNFWRTPNAETWTNMPLAETRFNGITASSTATMDLRRFSRARFSLGVSVVGAAAAVLRIKYSTYPSYGADVVFSPDLSLAALGSFATAWFLIPDGARLDMTRLTIWGQGGDGAADPQIRGATLEMN